MATRSEKAKAAATIAGNLAFIVAVVIAIGVALGFLINSVVVGTALPVIVIIGLLIYIAVKVGRKR